MGAGAARKLASDGFNVAILSSSGKGEALARELGPRGPDTGAALASPPCRLEEGTALALVTSQHPVHPGLERLGNLTAFERLCWAVAGCLTAPGLWQCVWAGEYQDHAKFGMGIPRWLDGQVNTGLFRDGHWHGAGRAEWPRGDVFEGMYANGDAHWLGVLTSANGDIRTGSYEADEPHGTGRCETRCTRATAIAAQALGSVDKGKIGD